MRSWYRLNSIRSLWRFGGKKDFFRALLLRCLMGQGASRRRCRSRQIRLHGHAQSKWITVQFSLKQSHIHGVNTGGPKSRPAADDLIKLYFAIRFSIREILMILTQNHILYYMCLLRRKQRLIWVRWCDLLCRNYNAMDRCKGIAGYIYGQIPPSLDAYDNMVILAITHGRQQQLWCDEVAATFQTEVMWFLDKKPFFLKNLWLYSLRKYLIFSHIFTTLILRVFLLLSYCLY